MAAEAPFSLSRVTADDMPELLDVQYEAFPDFVRIIFMGCHSKDDLPKLIPKYIQKMQSDPSDVWVKVTDNETGKIIAASNWKVFPGEPSDNHADEPPDWLESEEKEKSRKVIEEMTEIRKKAMPGPYVHLHILFTDAAYRRRGAGHIMMRWGCDLMDQLFVPGYIEASEEGNFLYKTFGFYDLQKLDMGGTAMKRDPRETPIAGGRPKVK